MNHTTNTFKSSLAFLSVILMLVALAIACTGESSEEAALKAKVTASNAYCVKYEKDYLPHMACYAVITNGTDKKLKDVEVTWRFLSRTGTEVNSENYTEMDFFEPGKSRKISKRDIPDPSLLRDQVKQTVKYECVVDRVKIAE